MNIENEARASASLDGDTQTWSDAAQKFAETMEQLGPEAVKSFIALVEEGKPEMTIKFTLHDGTEEVLTSEDIRQGLEILALTAPADLIYDPDVDGADDDDSG